MCICIYVYMYICVYIYVYIYIYTHFFEDGHRGLEDVIVMIIDKTDVSKPVEREGFRVYKLNSLVPHGLNLNDF